MLWYGNRQAQEYRDTHVFTTVYDQDSFEPVARLVWLKPSLLEASNDEQYSDKPNTPNNPIQIYHYHNDHLGTPNELTNNQGEVVWLADYEAWGNTAKVVWHEVELQQIQIAKDELQPIRFQGQYVDQETGLHYNRFRYYDPDVGMFISRDPIGLMGGNNVFQYAPNPIGWIDPWGLSGRGGANHQNIQKVLEDDLGSIYGSDRVKSEGQIKLGNGKSRFGDVVVYTDATKTKIQEVHQIGDMRTRGGFKPSSRERGAIMDIRQSQGNDVKIVYHDKKQRVTLINPDLLDDNWKAPADRHRKLPDNPKGKC